MQKIRYVIFCALIILIASACSNAAQPDPTPTVTRELQRNPNLDMKPILREFLANLPADWNLVAPQDVARRASLIVDVRQPDEYVRGFIAGALNIPLRDLARSLTALPDLEKEILVVCDTGHRGAIGMAILQILGYKKARTLEGGMNAWQAAKQPTVTAPVPARSNARAPKIDPQVQAMLDYYLVHNLPFDWGIVTATALTADQKLIPSSAADAMPETYDQGPSLIVNVDPPDEYAKSAVANVHGVFNFPLPQLPDRAGEMPSQFTVDFG